MTEGILGNYIGSTGYRYTYEELPSGERQYDTKRLLHSKIVRAKYVDTYLYNGNPYIEALPFPYSVEEISKKYTKTAGLPSKEKFYQFNKNIQNLLVDNIDQSFRITLPYHLDLEEEFYRTLVQSYSKRVQDPTFECLEVNNNPYFIKHGLKAFHSGEAVDCFSMLGVAGSGKSTAMNMVLDHYPQVIIHELDGETIVQIVYLYVTCDAYSNFNGLYESIGKAIDTALGNGNHTIRDEIVNSRNKSLAAKCSKIKDLIRKYSIGIIIFDEIQNIDMTSTKENSIETLLILNNDTHCGMGVLGTEEAFSAMFSKDRTTRRFASFIAASKYCENGRVFENIVRSLFANQVFEEWVDPDGDMIVQFYKESGGIIAYAVKLYQYLIKDYVKCRNKPTVDAEYIRKVSASQRKIIHDERGNS